MRKFILILILSTFVFARFIKYDNKPIIIDTDNFLMWQDDFEVKSVEKNWIDAIKYCENLILGGYNDWRLPNINELYSIVDEEKIEPSIEKIFKNVKNEQYWSSTTYRDGKSQAWGIYFDHGRFFWTSKTMKSYVRCVRGGE